ncbi:MAG: hypothetical protein KDC93_03905 [Cyclobacteriaceae bacterium]|jgi:hypothetical protein|nr:hypothetical protein [Cyclobacteriaceae bacterium]
MKAWFALLFSIGFFFNAQAQLRIVLPASSPISTDGLSKFPLQSYHYKKIKHKPSNIWLAQTSSYTGESGTTYWTGNITTQSYGKGKWGTFYYWDVQGNLRDMKGFIDIAGKNKRGLKLVFPWR